MRTAFRLAISQPVRQCPADLINHREIHCIAGLMLGKGDSLGREVKGVQFRKTDIDHAHPEPRSQGKRDIIPFTDGVGAID